MPTTLPTIRANVRRDLHDEDSGNCRWTDNEIDRAIDRAVRLFSRYVPRQQKSTLTTTAGSRAVSISTLADLLSIEKVEYPVDQFPQEYCRFSLWATTLTLLGDKEPAAVENVYVFWNSLHTLDATTSTLPTWAEPLVALGAAAYASLEWASYASNRVNVGGDRTWRYYHDFGQARLKEFQDACKQFGGQSRVRTRRLYAPAIPPDSQTTDYGP